jgi:hypothetical protein
MHLLLLASIVLRVFSLRILWPCLHSLTTASYGLYADLLLYSVGLYAVLLADVCMHVTTVFYKLVCIFTGRILSVNMHVLPYPIGVYAILLPCSMNRIHCYALCVNVFTRCCMNLCDFQFVYMILCIMISYSTYITFIFRSTLLGLRTEAWAAKWQQPLLPK